MELPGTHRTVVCLTNKDDITKVARALEAVGDIFGKKTTVVGYTFFGPNTVLILMDEVEQGKKMQDADAAGTKESKGKGRVSHVTAPGEPV